MKLTFISILIFHCVCVFIWQEHSFVQCNKNKGQQKKKCNKIYLTNIFKLILFKIGCRYQSSQKFLFLFNLMILFNARELCHPATLVARSSSKLIIISHHSNKWINDMRFHTIGLVCNKQFFKPVYQKPISIKLLNSGLQWVLFIPFEWFQTIFSEIMHINHMDFYFIMLCCCFFFFSGIIFHRNSLEIKMQWLSCFFLFFYHNPILSRLMSNDFLTLICTINETHHSFQHLCWPTATEVFGFCFFVCRHLVEVKRWHSNYLEYIAASVSIHWFHL